MNILTPTDAKYVLGGFGILIPFLIAWLPTIKIADYLKFTVLVLFSLIGGFLTVVATEQFISSGSIIQNGAVVLTAAQIFYYGAFRGLGLERVLFPQQALATEAREQAKDSVPTVSTNRAKDILDPTTPPQLVVSSEIVNNKS